MFAIIGILLVFGAVIGGFLMEKGHLAVLLQPAEFLIIAGAALGTLLIANPLHTLKLGGPPEAIGHKVAAALVGTFLGILLCYGLVGPIGSYMSKEAEEEHAFLHVLRVLMISFIKGNAPVQAVEMARRAIPLHVRPTFEEVEAACHGQHASDAPAEQKVA
jgi:flagellar motor component MotA